MKSKGRKWAIGLAAAIAVSTVASTTSAAGRPSVPSAKKGGEVVYAIPDSLNGWCFSTALTGGPLGVSRMVYESLVERDAKGNFIPHLAQSWTPSEANKVWTFKLRPNIKFSTGEAFNAEAVKMNMDLGRGYTYGPKNVTYGSTGVGVNANIVSVDVVDDLTVKVTLDQPDADFIALMYRAGRYVMRAPSQALKADGSANNTANDPNACASKPLGTGPFMVQSWEPNNMVFVRNPLYWRKDKKGVQLPYLDQVTVTVVKEGLQRALAVRKGTVDAAYFGTVDATFIRDLQKRKSQVTEFKGNANSWGQWMPNVNKAGSPFKYKNCRLAAAHAVDWKTYNAKRLRGLGVYSGSIVGKDHIMFTTKGAPKYSVAKAKEYLAACNTDLGAAGPMKVTLYADTTSASLNNAKEIKRQMDAAGIGTNEIFQAEATTLVNSYIYVAGGNKMDFAQGTPAEGPGSGYVTLFFITKAFPTGAKSPVANTALGKGYNTITALGNHSDTKVDDLVLAAKAETDAKLRKQKFQAATEYMQSEGLTIPTLHTGAWTFVSKKAKLGGIGQFLNPDGKTFAPTKDVKGFEWTGIWKG